MRLIRLPSILFSGLLLLWGCAGSTASPGPSRAGTSVAGAGHARSDSAADTDLPEMSVSFTVVADSLPEDRAMEDLVAPYRQRMGQEIRTVIGQAATMLTEAVPEGTLGNFAADAMLWAARRHSAQPVQMALMNNGGLRIPIAAGPITVEQMFELMPFENLLTVLTLSGEQVIRLANELAARRGEPIAGFSFRLEERDGAWAAQDLRVNGNPVDPRGRYRLVTNDYMANGGENLSALLSPLEREDLGVLVRDAFIEYVRAMGVIDVELEGRIRGGIGS